MQKITLYIPCRNAEKFISGCLESVSAQSLKPAEVIVVDDNSADQTVAMAKKFPVKVIRLPSHPGLAAARNAALTAARHDYVASIDVDCVPEPTWLERLMTCVKDKKVAGAGGRLVEAYQETLADRWRAVHMRQNWGDNRLEDPPFLFGCNTLFRKKALEEIGLYDTRFRTNGEDLDLSHRLKAKGHKLVYEPTALVRHLKRDTVLSVLKGDWRWGYVSLGDTVKFERNSNIIYHNFSNARYRFQKDTSLKRYSLLPLDIMLFFVHTYLDICHARRLNLAKPTGEGFSSRIETLVNFHSHLARLSDTHFLQNPDSRIPQNSRGGEAV